jgi:hypothetical protein
VRLGTAVLFALALASCNRSPSPLSTVPPPLHVGLGGGAVARVGEVTLPGSLVGSVAAAQQTDARTACESLIDDALAAQGENAALEGNEGRDPSVAWAITSILGRTVAERVRATARAAGAPTDEEVAQLSRVHQADVDAPEKLVVAHAVVRRPEDRSRDNAARAVAAQIAAAVSGVATEAAFEARAGAVPRGAFEVVIQTLPPFAADTPAFDPAFVRGAFTLKKSGDISGIVESSAGWHVIRLLERLPPKFMPIAQRRTAFADEVLRNRAQRALEQLLHLRRASTSVSILPDAEARMAELTARGAP